MVGFDRSYSLCAHYKQNNIYTVESVRLRKPYTREMGHLLWMLELLRAPVSMRLTHLVLLPMAVNAWCGSDTGRVSAASFTMCDSGAGRFRGKFWILDWICAWRDGQIHGDVVLYRALASGVSICLAHSGRRPMVADALRCSDNGCVLRTLLLGVIQARGVRTGRCGYSFGYFPGVMSRYKADGDCSIWG